MDPVMIFKSIGTGLMAGGQLEQGKAVQQSRRFEAKQLEAQGKARYAEGTRDAYESRRQADIVQSNARAAMAASGGVTTDEGATEQLAAIQSEGQYNALAALFNAETDRDALNLRADAARYEGKLARRESKRKALATVIGGVADTWGGFNPTSTASGNNPTWWSTITGRQYKTKPFSQQSRMLAKQWP